MPTIFTKIINQEIPSYKIFENDLVYAFLDINPVQVGHTLIVPKIEKDYFLDVPEPYYSEVFRVAKIVSPAIQKVSKCLRVGIMVQGTEVPHFHLHLIPIFENTPFLDKPKQLEKPEMERVCKEIAATINL